MIARAIKDVDIPRAVIPAFAVAVVDRLAGQKMSAQLFFGDKDMFKDVAIGRARVIRRVAVDIAFGVDGPPSPPVGVVGTVLVAGAFLCRPPPINTCAATKTAPAPLAIPGSHHLQPAAPFAADPDHFRLVWHRLLLPATAPARPLK